MRQVYYFSMVGDMPADNEGPPMTLSILNLSALSLSDTYKGRICELVLIDDISRRAQIGTSTISRNRSRHRPALKLFLKFYMIW